MLDQIDINSVKVGQDAEITFDAYPTTPVKSLVSSKDTTPTQSSGVVSYEVKLIPNDASFTGTILS